MSRYSDWREGLLRGLYNVLLYLLLPLVLLRLYWRGRNEAGHRQRWAERLGYIPALPQAGCLWIHAVSVGEVRAALPLIRALRVRYPETPLLVTTTTLTGSRQVLDALNGQVHHVYAPYDLPGAVRRFLQHVQPRLTILMETELWPNLLRGCALSGVPVLLANARLSERSARGYRRVQPLTAAMLRDVTLIAAQSEADTGRFRALGAPRVRTVGNLKYDLEVPDSLLEQGRALRRDLFGDRRPVWIAASTHVGEEEQILQAFIAVTARWPDLLLLLVPRHPERFAAVAGLCEQQGLSLVRRSERRACRPETAVFLGDSMGELLLFYAAADLAFVGGSLVPTGGHNVLEPALLGLPVLFGPHMFNFTEAAERLLAAQAAWQINSVEELEEAIRSQLAAPNGGRDFGERGKMVVEQHRGGLQTLLGCVDALLAKS